MSTPSNRRRLGECRDVDRINNLPDVILCHILSFLPTKSVVVTSTLSKQWKYLWTKVVALDFTGKAFLNPFESLSLKEKISFERFVNRLLFHNNASYLRHLCLDVPLGVDDFHVKSWLSAIAGREIQMVTITNCHLRQDCVSLPSELLSSEKLVTLKLSGKFSIDLPTSLHLPNLKIIHLTGLQLPGDEILKRLALGCSVLRKLHIMFCDGLVSTLHIESSTLETLDIETSFIASRSPLACITRASNLRYLGLRGTPTTYDISNLSLLVKEDQHMRWNNAAHVRKLLENISRVKTARLEITRVFGYVSKLPIFLNLTRLRLLANGNMAKLLNYAPMIKSLIIQPALSVDYPLVTKVWPERHSSLENVELQIFKDVKEYMALVAQFLKVASALKEMKIVMYLLDKKHVLDAYPVLLALPRSSPSCQVKVVC